MTRLVKVRPTTVWKEFCYWNKEFLANGVSEPTSSIRHILSHVLGVPHFALAGHFKNFLKRHQKEILYKFCRQRLQRTPIQYILGEWSFRDLTLRLRPPVFIPRPETEELVSLALRHLQEEGPKRILDMCCGSGAIALSIANECKEAQCVAVDKSPSACELAKENAVLLDLKDRVEIFVGNLTSGTIAGCSVHGPFDLIVSNPPYLTKNELGDLQPEISWFEDECALNGGFDGLDVVRDVLKLSSSVLLPGGRTILEVGPEHPPVIRDLVKEAFVDLKVLDVFRDFSRVQRFVEIQKLR